MINPKSAQIASKHNDEEIYQKGVNFVQQKEHARQLLARYIIESEDNK